jgi:predicted nuclease with RNAse H fold
MRVLGLDLAASPAKTGAVIVRPAAAGRWSAHELAGRLDDDRLVEAAREVDAIGVDAPLGWPVAFVEAVAAHHGLRPWPGTDDRSTLTHRDTDRVTWQWTQRLPMSASADRLGSVAMRCALLQQRWADEVWGLPAPRDGEGRLLETYPAAAFLMWGIDCRGYKRAGRLDDATRKVRSGVVDGLATRTEAWLDLEPVRDRCVESDHLLDALVCALVVVAARAGATYQPRGNQRRRASVEGWIHVPSGLLTAVRPTPMTAGQPSAGT